MAGPYEHAGWTFAFDRGEDGNRFTWEEPEAADAQLLGRVTYEAFAPRLAHHDRRRSFADKMSHAQVRRLHLTFRRFLEQRHHHPRRRSEGGHRAQANRHGDLLVAGAERSSTPSSATRWSTSFA